MEKVTIQPAVFGTRYRQSSRGVCKHCHGAGWLLRPAKQKLLTFAKCTSCRGLGVRWKALKK